MQKTILIIEDQPSELRNKTQLAHCSLEFLTINSAYNENLKQLESALAADVFLLNLNVDIETYGHWIRSIKARKPQIPLIALIAWGEDHHAAHLLRSGADDYVTRPFTLERLILTLQTCLRLQYMSSALARLERRPLGRMHFSDLVHVSSVMAEAIAFAKLAAISSAPVWLQGEPGTGKELLARAIHGESERIDKPFVALRCEHFADDHPLANGDSKEASLAAMTTLLLDADRGTVYLDNIGLLPLTHQYRILDILESGAVTIHGVSKPLHFRLICSSKRSPVDFFKEGLYLLYKRFQTIIAIPPLRERRQDIGLLADHFIRLHCGFEKKYMSGLHRDALHGLEQQSWHGNVTELKNLLHRAVLLCAQEELDMGTLRLVEQLQPTHYAAGVKTDGMPTVIDMKGHIKKLKSIEEEMIRYALDSSNGSMTRAARKLGIGRSTLYRKLHLMGFDPHIERANQITRPMMEASASKRS